MQVIHEGNEKTLGRMVDKELDDLGVKPYVYHIRAYGEGSRRRILGSFNSITIVDPIKMPTADVEHDVGEAIEGLIKERMMYGNKVPPATFMMKELREMGYYGIAICDRRDNFSRKRGRIIAKGRLLKYLRSRPVMMYGRAEMDQRVVAKGRLVKGFEDPELIDGTKW